MIDKRDIRSNIWVEIIGFDELNEQLRKEGDYAKVMNPDDKYQQVHFLTMCLGVLGVSLLGEYKSFYSYDFLGLDKIKGIPINPDLLKEVGFEPFKGPYSDVPAYQRGEVGGVMIWCNGHLFVPDENGFIKITKQNLPIDKKPCEFLHQLQNIVYDLKGEDLIITEEIISRSLI